jgi:hypothetical protein
MTSEGNRIMVRPRDGIVWGEVRVESDVLIEGREFVF